MKPRMGYKIAIVCDWYLPRIGGLELHLRDLARELNARGHEAHVITATPGPDELDGVKVHRLDVPLMPGLDTIRSQEGARAARGAVPARAVRHHPRAHGAVAAGDRRHSRRQEARHPVGDDRALGARAARAGAALSTLHKIWGWADWPDVLTAVSHYVANDMRDVSGRSDVYVLPNGINPRDWKPHNPPQADEKLPLRVTTVMRFTKRKRPHR